MDFAKFLNDNDVNVYSTGNFDSDKLLEDSIGREIYLQGIDGLSQVEMRASLSVDSFKLMMTYRKEEHIENKVTHIIPMEDDLDNEKSVYEAEILDFFDTAFVREDELSEMGLSLAELRHDFEQMPEQIAVEPESLETEFIDGFPMVIDGTEEGIMNPVIDNMDDMLYDSVFYAEEDAADSSFMDTDMPQMLKDIPVPEIKGTDTAGIDAKEESHIENITISKLPHIEKIAALPKDLIELSNHGVITSLTTGKEPVFSKAMVEQVRSIDDSFGRVLDGRIDTAYSFSINTGNGVNDSIAKYLEVPKEAVVNVNVRQSREPFENIREREMQFSIDGKNIRITPEIRLTEFEIQLKDEGKVHQAFLVDNAGRIHYEVPIGTDRVIGVSNGEDSGTMRFDFLDMTSANYMEPVGNLQNPFFVLERNEEGKLSTDQSGNYILARDEDGQLVHRFSESGIKQVREELCMAVDNYKAEICDSIYDKMEDRAVHMERDVHIQQDFRDAIAEAYSNIAFEYKFAASHILDHGMAFVKEEDIENEGKESLTIAEITREISDLNNHINGLDKEDEGMETAKERADILLDYLSEAVGSYKEAGLSIEIGEAEKNFEDIAKKYADLKVQNDIAETKLYRLEQNLEAVIALKSTPPDQVGQRFESLVYSADHLDMGMEKFSMPNSLVKDADAVKLKENLVKEWNAMEGHEKMQISLNDKGEIYSQYGFRIDDADKNHADSEAIHTSDFFFADQMNTEKIEISETALFEKEDGSFEKESIERYAESRIEDTDHAIFEIRDLFLDFVGHGHKKEEIERLGLDIEGKSGYGAIASDILSDIGGNTDYSEGLRQKITGILKEAGFEVSEDSVDKPDVMESSVRDIEQPSAIPMSKDDIENLARNVDRHGAGRINMDMVGRDGKPKVELADHVKEIPERTLEKLEKIADNIMKIEGELSVFDQRYHNNPLITRQDKGYMIRVHERDGLIHDYEKAGGKIGKECFITKGVTSMELFSSFTTAWRADPYLTAIYRILSHDTYKEIMDERKDMADNELKEKQSVEREALHQPDLPEQDKADDQNALVHDEKIEQDSIKPDKDSFDLDEEKADVLTNTGELDTANTIKEEQDSKADNAAVSHAGGFEVTEFDNEKLVEEIKERIDHVLDGNDNVEDSFINAVGKGDITVEDICTLIEDAITERGSLENVNPETIAALYNHAADISDNPNDIYDQLNSIIDGKVEEEFIEKIEECECEHVADTPYEDTNSGEILDIVFNERGELLNGILADSLINPEQMLEDITYDSAISSVEWSELSNDLKEALMERGYELKAAMDYASTYLESDQFDRNDLDSFDMNAAIDFIVQANSLDVSSDMVDALPVTDIPIELPSEFKDTLAHISEVLIDNGMNENEARTEALQYMDHLIHENPDIHSQDIDISGAADFILDTRISADSVPDVDVQMDSQMSQDTDYGTDFPYEGLNDVNMEDITHAELEEELD